jgi:fido (protein-threonine AMPylation protein)
MAKYSNDDHYVDPESGVLKNRLGITDEARLEENEAAYVAAFHTGKASRFQVFSGADAV